MICLVAETPVAGTVARLAHWIAHYSDGPCIPLIMRNYANNSFPLPTGALQCLPDWRRIFAETVAEADTIIVHNLYGNSTANRERLDIVFGERKPGTRVLFQVHSPPREGPAMLYDTLRDYPFDGELVVAQGYGRFRPDAIAVPNVVPDFTFPFRPQKQRRILVAHMRSTAFRWSRKLTESDMAALEAQVAHFSGYEFTGNQDAFGRDMVTHQEMMLLLLSGAMLIDDINTGLMHQTTFEGLKAGAAVFSAADPLTIEEACEALEMDLPPLRFVQNVHDVIDLLRDPALHQQTRAFGRQSQAFADRFLGEARVSKLYWDRLVPLL